MCRKHTAHRCAVVQPGTEVVQRFDQLTKGQLLTEIWEMWTRPCVCVPMSTKAPYACTLFCSSRTPGDQKSVTPAYRISQCMHITVGNHVVSSF